MTRPFLRLNIRRRRAAPDKCPECGHATYPEVDSLADLFRTDKGTYAALKYYYTWPVHVFSEEVPGWPGYRTWVYSCRHEEGFKLDFSDNPLLAFIPKKTEFQGSEYFVPISLHHSVH